MSQPLQPDELLAFEPPHCPFPDCPEHHLPKPTRFWIGKGYRRVRRAPGLVRRYQCKACGRKFSSSAFDESYWKKIPGLSGAVFTLLANGQCLRQAARTLEVAPTTVRRRARRNAGQSLLQQLEMLEGLEIPEDERVVYDGLRTYAGSQYEPCEVQTGALAERAACIEANAAPLRRSGAMTPRQKEERRRRELWLGLPEPGVRVKRSREAFERLLTHVPEDQEVRLDTDKEPAYGRAVGQLDQRSRIDHRTTSSKRRRTVRNPLWRVNHLHRLMRHSLANLKRETIAHSKTLAGLMDRVLSFLAWLNMVKGISERRVADARRTPAMLLGLATAPVRSVELLHERRFPARCGLPEELRELYEGTIRARPRENVRPYRYKIAY